MTKGSVDCPNGDALIEFKWKLYDLIAKSYKSKKIDARTAAIGVYNLTEKLEGEYGPYIQDIKKLAQKLVDIIINEQDHKEALRTLMILIEDHISDNQRNGFNKHRDHQSCLPLLDYT